MTPYTPILSHALACSGETPPPPDALSPPDGSPAVDTRRLLALTETLRGVNRLLVRHREEPELIHGLCRTIVQAGAFERVWILLTSPDRRVRLQDAAGFDPAGRALLPELGTDAIPDCITRALDADMVICRDVHSPDCRRCVFRELGGGLRTASVGLRYDERVFGVMSVLSASDMMEATDERAMLQEIAGVVGAALHRNALDRHRLRTEADLRDSERLFTLFMDNLPSGVQMRDRNGTVLFANRYMREHFGANRWIGQPTDVVFGPERGAAVRREDAAVLRDGPCSLVTTLTDAHGDERTLDECRFPVRGLEQTEVVGVVSLDITDLRDVESERRRVQAMLEQAQKLEAVGRLTGGVAHDFNNVLTAIIGYAEMLHDEARASGGSTEKLDVIRQAADQAANLTAQLLAFTRKESLEERLLDVNDVIEQLRKVLLRVLGEDVELDWRPGASLRRIKGDHTQLVQIVMNLAVNARDAMPGGGRLTIETENLAPDPAFRLRHPDFPAAHAVRLRVCDTGCGMDQATRERVFEPFFTTKASGRGTGLGLATVARIAEQHHAPVEVDSVPGEGAAFAIVFPADDGEEEARESTEEDAAGRGEGRVVLLVEDEAPVRGLAREVLDMHGYTVLEAADADDALRVAATCGRNIDLVLSDVVMPRMSGPDLYRRLVRERPGVKVLFMSGYTDDRIDEKGLIDGAPLLRKPFSRTRLLSEVETAITETAAGSGA